MSINWQEKGYPQLHSGRFRSAKIYAATVVSVTALLFLLTLGGTLLGPVPPLVTAVVAAVFVAFGLLGGVTCLYDTTRYVQVIPYFQRRLGGIDTFLAGQSIARNLKQLDEIALLQDVPPLSTFGFADDLRGESLIWHDPNKGLQTILAIQEYLRKGDVPQALVESLTLDLEKWQHALERAAAENVLFCILLRHGNTTSGHEWDVRKGSAF